LERNLEAPMRLMPLALAAVLAIAVPMIMPLKTSAADKKAAWTPPPDPFLWLEDVDGARAMTWVKGQNTRTLDVLEKDPRFAKLHAEALAIAEAKDRIPSPSFLSGQIYNFWQDADHVQGIWRKTGFQDYGKAEPGWSTVIDVDALSKAEGKTWVWRGANCLQPDQRLCMVSLSAGGEDAVTVREFDLEQGRFVEGGFELPKSKQDVTWEDHDHLIVGRDWGPGSMTESGYAYILKRVARGQPLDKAVEVFRGTPKDVGVNAYEVRDGSGNHVILIDRQVSFFEKQLYLLTPSGARRFALPAKVVVGDMVAGRFLLQPKQDWTVGGKTFKAGTLLSLDLAALKAYPEHLKPTLVYAPGPRETIESVTETKNRLLVTIYENVRGRLYVYEPTSGGGWSRRKLDLPDNASVDVAAVDNRSDRAFVSVAGFLDPSTLYLLDAATGALSRSKALPPRFDASRDAVEQREATSTDGTKIPYFIVHPKGMKLDGSNPTLLYAYGGFENSLTPSYSPVLGKLWLERGGVFVLANIRGGGEFGPRWHEAGLKTRRQVIYDDFAAVAKDLIARKVTSPRRLGIQGGSNGGLLMGVEMTQHPELWNAVDIQVPLLDMLRYEKIAAGASWVGEFGSVQDPKERAFLERISPYQKLKAGARYPEPLIWTTTKDDRVGPQHARKFAAKMAQMGLPYLYYEVIEGGHGAGANQRERARTSALEYVYFTRKLMD
jgi:prolyl oligopeptidase